MVKRKARLLTVEAEHNAHAVSKAETQRLHSVATESLWAIDTAASSDRRKRKLGNNNDLLGL
jgi:hypothetical protein